MLTFQRFLTKYISIIVLLFLNLFVSYFYFKSSYLQSPIIVFCFLIVTILAYGTLLLAPQLLISQGIPVRLIPDLYYIVGCGLIAIGSALPVLAPEAITYNLTTAALVEFVPLTLGAVVGGGYCVEAILGIEFEGKLRIIRTFWSLVGAITIMFAVFAVAPVFREQHILHLGSSAIFATLPFLALLGIRWKEKSKDFPFWLISAGLFLVFCTVLEEIIICWYFQINFKPLQHEKHVLYDLMKYLIPSYSGAIGVGLVIRGVEKNIITLNKNKWLRRSLRGFPFRISINGITIEPSNTSSITKVAEVKFEIGPSLWAHIGDYPSNRMKIASNLNDWLRQEVEKRKNHATVELASPPNRLGDPAVLQK